MLATTTLSLAKSADPRIRGGVGPQGVIFFTSIKSDIDQKNGACGAKKDIFWRFQSACRRSTQKKIAPAARIPIFLDIQLSPPKTLKELSHSGGRIVFFGVQKKIITFGDLGQF